MRFSGLICPFTVRREFTIPICGRHAAIHQKIASSNKRAFRPHEQRSYGSHLVRRTRSSSSRYVQHPSIAWPAWSAQFIICERSDDYPWANRVNPRTALSPPYRLRHHAQRVPALRYLIRVQRVFHLIRLDHGQSEQFVCRSRRERSILFSRERRQAMAGLRRDYDS